MKKDSGFTLQEILIVVTIITLLFAFLITLLDPLKQLAKARDAKRKSDLAVLKKICEEYYNDHRCYPKPNEICYPSTEIGYNPQVDNRCYICGENKSLPINFNNLIPYIKNLPCDPQYPTHKYLYEVDNPKCPKWFRIYSKLNSAWNREDDIGNCGKGGCGPAPNFGYDYGASSPNINLNKTPHFYCYTITHTCDNCGGLQGDYHWCYDNPNCLETYPSRKECCQRTPKPIDCR